MSARDCSGGSTISGQLGSWATGLVYADIPADVTALARRHLLDATGIHVAARDTELGRAAIEAAAADGFAAAARDGILISCLDFDDTHEETLIHASSAVVPVIFEALRRGDLFGADVITALVAGFETSCRIGLACNSQLHPRGFHPTGVLGSIGAAVAGAKLRGFDAARTEHAIGLAASFGAGLMQCMADGGDARYVHPGAAAVNGMLAVSLSAVGFAGSGRTIEGPAGLLRAHVQAPELLNTDIILRDLGEAWTSRSLTIKPYPTGFVTHEFIDAVFELVRERSLSPDDIESIVCRLPERALRLVFEPLEEKRRPTRATAARVALPHILAEAMVYGQIGAASFSEARLQNPAVHELASRVDYVRRTDEAANEVSVVLKSGETIAISTARRSFGSDDLIAKFAANTQALPSDASRQLAEEILGSETRAGLPHLRAAIGFHY